MASSKNPIFKVKLKSSQKKRRKSDLVVMWHSMVDATVQIIKTIHFLLLEALESTRLLIWRDEIQDIRQFLKNYLPVVPDDFSNSWRDGKLLCILLNKLQPGCIPDAETLDRNYALRNMYHAFDVLERKFGVSPTTSVEQLVVCVEGSHLKLLEILSQLKKETENRLVPSIQVEDVETENEIQNYCPDSKNCISKGTGLMVAFAGRPANFFIFSSTMADINLVIEIKGPCETVCRERITKRSPKKKNSTTLLKQRKPHFFRSSSFSEKNIYKPEGDNAEDAEKNLIPLEYAISLDKISVTYTPLVEGQHVISILWYGQHVSDSPYLVKVEPAFEAKSMHSTKQLSPSYDFQDNNDDNENKGRKNGTVTIQKPADKIERIGRVIKRRVLRHIVKIKDKDIIVDSNDIDHLAAALLKMDYEIQTDPSKSRRNSWGFTGDAERKISAIRQFCIPLHELDAQNMKLTGRSRSLTINSDPKMPLRRSNSLEDEDFIRQTRLDTVSEDPMDGYMLKLQGSLEDEEEYAYINEDFQTIEQPDGIQNGISDDNTEKVAWSFSSIKNTVPKNLLQSQPIEEEDEVSRNDLNAESYLVLPPNDLTGSSKFLGRSARENGTQFISDNHEDIENEFIINAQSERGTKNSHNDLSRTNSSGLPQKDLTSSSEFSERLAVNNEMAYNSDLYEDIENELKMNADTFSDTCNKKNFNSNSTPGIPGYFQDQSEINNCFKTNFFEDKKEIVKIYNDLEAKNRNEGSLTVLAGKMPNLGKCEELFFESGNESAMSPENDPKVNYQFSSVDDENNWRSSPIESSRNINSFRLKKHREGFKNRRYCKSCRQLEILNKKLIVRNKKINQKNSAFFKTNNSESIRPDFTQNKSTPLFKNIKIDSNHELKKQNSVDSQKSNHEFSNSKLTFFDSPGKYSFYYYPHSSDDSATVPNFSQSGCKIETNIGTNKNGNKTFPLNSKLDTLTNSLQNSRHGDVYNNSTLRLNCGSSNSMISSALEINDNPVIKFKEVSDTSEFQFKEHNLISLGQYNFNQFNPYVEKSKGSLIKNKIKKLERAMVRDSNKANSKYSSRSSISSDTVNVKDKLSFWENLGRKDKKMNQTKLNITDDSTAEVNNFEEEYSARNTKPLENYDTALEGEPGTLDFSWPKDDTLGDLENNLTPNNEAINLNPTESNEIQFPSQHHEHSFKMQRSFSDPMLLDPALRDSLIFAHNSPNTLKKTNHVSSTDYMSSSGDYLESSIDDGLYSSDPFVSTEDEYIDDEIPGNPLLTHWGDLNIMKSLKTANTSKYKEYCQFVDTEVLKNQFQSVEICPSECKVFGIGTYYGYVAVKNRFQVLTKGAGNGNLSASVQGFGKHDVSFVSVKYKHKDIYEVTYQVLRPGLYLISLRWMEKPIVGSPFLCKVTF